MSDEVRNTYSIFEGDARLETLSPRHSVLIFNNFFQTESLGQEKI